MPVNLGLYAPPASSPPLPPIRYPNEPRERDRENPAKTSELIRTSAPRWALKTSPFHGVAPLSPPLKLRLSAQPQAARRPPPPCS